MKNVVRESLIKKCTAFVMILVTAITVMMSGLTNVSAATPSIWYRVHVKDIGWMTSVSNGDISGTTGRGLRVEGFEIDLSGVSGGVKYRCHSQNIGWSPWRTDCQTAGTTGRSLRAEAMQVMLTGQAANLYNIKYRTHIQNIGWTDWVYNGAVSGTTGRSLQIEAMQIVLEPKAPANNYDAKVNAFISDSRWKNNAYYPGSKSPIIASYSASGCCAYAADFVKYVYGHNGFSKGGWFSNPNEIRTGDVLKVIGSQHWIVVLYRNGNRLTTAEGNWTGGRVNISSSAYTVQNNTLCRNGSRFRTFSNGYHFR